MFDRTIRAYFFAVGWLVNDDPDNPEVGRIARMLQTVEREQRPVQQRLDQFSRSIAVIELVLVSCYFQQFVISRSILERASRLQSDSVNGRQNNVMVSCRTLTRIGPAP